MAQFRMAVVIFATVFFGGNPVNANYNAVLDRIFNSYLNSRSTSDLGIGYRDLGAAIQRDEEYIPENTLWGYQYISGKCIYIYIYKEKIDNKVIQVGDIYREAKSTL